MKLNFWQWLGVIVLLIVVPIYIYRTYIAPKKSPATDPASMSTQSGHQAASESEYFESAPAK